MVVIFIFFAIFSTPAATAFQNHPIIKFNPNHNADQWAFIRNIAIPAPFINEWT